MDSSDPDLFEYYKEVSRASAKKYYSNTMTFGKFRNMNLIEWLRENTEKKHDLWWKYNLINNWKNKYYISFCAERFYNRYKITVTKSQYNKRTLIKQISV